MFDKDGDGEISMDDSTFTEVGVKSAKLSEVIQEKLERMILEGVLQPGEKLPLCAHGRKCGMPGGLAFGSSLLSNLGRPAY